jgi:hypothetical protein
MNRDTQVTERPEVELDGRWRGTAIAGATAAVVLLYLATAVLLLISLRRESPVAPVEGIGGGS